MRVLLQNIRLNKVPLPRFTGIAVSKFSFVGSFCHPVRSDSKFLWKGINLAKKEWILGLQLYCSCKQPVPLASEVILLLYTPVGRNHWHRGRFLHSVQLLIRLCFFDSGI